jgi:hypothetical protein
VINERKKALMAVQEWSPSYITLYHCPFLDTNLNFSKNKKALHVFFFFFAWGWFPLLLVAIFSCSLFVIIISSRVNAKFFYTYQKFTRQPKWGWIWLAHHLDPQVGPGPYLGM